MTPFMTRFSAAGVALLHRQLSLMIASLALVLAGIPASSSAGAAALATINTPQAGEPLVLSLAYGGTESISTGTPGDGTRATVSWNESEVLTIPSHLPTLGKPWTWMSTFAGSASYAVSSSVVPSSNFQCAAAASPALAHRQLFTVVAPMYSDMTNNGLTDPAAIAAQTISYLTFLPVDMGGKDALLEDQDSGKPMCRGLEGSDVLEATGSWLRDPMYGAAIEPNGLITEGSLDPARSGSPLTRTFKDNGTKDGVTVSLKATLTIAEQVTPTPVDLRIKDVPAKSDVTDTNVPKIVGQHILLEVMSTTGAPVEDIKWSIASGLPHPSGVAAVRDYPIETATNSLKPTYLEASNLDKDTVSFYWVKPASNYKVTVNGTVDGKPAKEADVTYSVEAPTVTMTSQTTHVEATTQEASAKGKHPMGFLSFGGAPGVTGISYVNVNGIRRTLKRFPGILWVFKATATAAEAGDLGMTQLIDDDISHNGTACYRSAGYVMDLPTFTRQGYDSDAPPLAHLAAGKSAVWLGVDTPGQSLIDVLGADVYRRSASFKDYFLYKPTGADSIWVTIGRMSWSFGGSAEYQATLSRWELQGVQHNPDPANPHGDSSSELPEWSEVHPKGNDVCAGQ